ncbi:MAG: hypothetical protein HC783_09645 [Rhodobacteraceae bacterium]|nr:hypothetical protein [Paracoccaceae bacterium]
MPLQPASATGTRDTLLAAADGYLLADWQTVCDQSLADGAPGCLMIVADLLPTLPGEEAMLLLQRSPDYTEALGLFLDEDGDLLTRTALRADGRYPDSHEAAELMRAWRDAPPPLTPALINQLGTGEAGLMILR